MTQLGTLAGYLSDLQGVQSSLLKDIYSLVPFHGGVLTPVSTPVDP